MKNVPRFAKSNCGGWQDPLAGPVGRTCWQDLLAGPVGRTCWQDLSAGPVGRTCWQDLLAGPVDGPVAIITHIGSDVSTFMPNQVGRPIATHN